MMNDQFQTSPRMVSKSGHSRWQKKHTLPVKDSALDGISDQFDQFLEAVKLQMQPEGRALHTAGMLEYLRTLLPNDVTLADLVAGWQVLAQPRNDTNSAVLSRRKTCGELAAIAAQLTSEQGNLRAQSRPGRHGSMLPRGAPIPVWLLCARPLLANSRNCNPRDSGLYRLFLVGHADHARGEIQDQPAHRLGSRCSDPLRICGEQVLAIG
jgi:hypothetical protein